MDANVIRDIAKIIEGAKLYALQPFNNANVLHPEFFKAIDPGYDGDELVHLKSIADPWVEKCSLHEIGIQRTLQVNPSPDCYEALESLNGF
ncbi:MAG: hypothetical protein PVF56_13210 [Desulfobacterales bacterium]